MKREPRGRAEMVTQILFGEQALLLKEVSPPPGSRERGWLRLRLLHDGYEGYAPREAFDLAERLLPSEEDASPHVISVPQTLLFPEPDIKSSPTQPLFMGSPVWGVERVGENGRFLRLASGGHIIANHARPATAPPAADPAAIAEMLLHAPYLWGGRTVAGIDCSGLVQLALRMAGHEHVPRDSAPQSREIGRELPLKWLGEPEKLRRGDLVFWKGHVAMLIAPDLIIHANAHHMMVACEPLAAAISRIERSEGSRPLALRRP